MDKTKTDFLKETPSDYPIVDLIKNRWSPRIFADTPITETDLQHLFEAGRWAPSSYNMQPWHIVWGIKGSETFDRIYKHLVEFNQNWVKHAGALLLGVVKTTNDKGENNAHAEHDLGQFAAMMSVQAQSMGIAVHQMAGVNGEEAKKEFNFPEEYKVVTAIALGHYGGNPENLESEQMEKQERSKRKRKRQEEFTYAGDFVDRAEV